MKTTNDNGYYYSEKVSIFTIKLKENNTILQIQSKNLQGYNGTVALQNDWYQL